MTRQKDVKKSNFPAITSLQTTDYLDLVRNGQNFKISVADFLTSLGVTGVLQTKGEVTAIPVLDIDSGISYIRNILGGHGILASLSPQDGVEIEHNFTIDKGGVPVVINESSASPTVRSIVAGTGISVGASGDEIQITNTEVPGTAKTVFVYEEADFPTPAGGVITLAGDTEYRLLNDITTVNRFVMGAGTILSAGNERLITLTYSGVGTMFTAVDSTMVVRDIGLVCSAGTAFDISSTTGAHDFICTNVLLTCGDIGTMDELNLIYFRATNLTASGAGLTITGACGTFFYSIGTITVSGVAAKAINFSTSTFTIISLQNIIFILADAGAYCISGLANSGNINAGGQATVFNTDQYGVGTFLENINHYDNFWDFVLNANSINSYTLALATHAGATTIPIAASATPVKITGVWNSQTMHRFTHDNDGRWTHTSKNVHLDVTASITVDLVTGIDDISFFIYRNGVQIPASKVTQEVNSGDPENISIIWNLEVDLNDYIEFWVQNDDTTVDVIIVNATIRISGVG